MNSNAYNEKTGLVIVCPITSKQKGYSFEVEVITKKVKGVAISNQIRTMDLSNRKYKLADISPEETVSRIVQKIKLVID